MQGDPGECVEELAENSGARVSGGAWQAQLVQEGAHQTHAPLHAQAADVEHVERVAQQLRAGGAQRRAAAHTQAHELE